MNRPVGHNIAITPGEPAGIGPDLLVMLAQQDFPARLVAVADQQMLQARAAQLGLPLTLHDYRPDATPDRHRPGELFLLACETAKPVSAGKADPGNVNYVLDTLDTAVTGCLDKEFAALVTGPVNKSLIAAAGHTFSGHTEYLADLCGARLQTEYAPVMLLANDFCRVALVTTHLPLQQVAAAVTAQRLEQTLRTVQRDLDTVFGLSPPRISVCGLNPHAGEQGHLGDEEKVVIEPVIERLRQEGLQLSGPVPADTAFTADALQDIDLVVAMYHDQALPVIKSHGFGDTVNISLGLPMIRTSVDHGTALDLAGSGRARPDSFIAAVHKAIELADRQA
ncbi:MAG: 4-hydroxythreonine-4-phosphate dehydrogenase PdxA [Gammaproteobacteria bacterium]